MTNPDARRGIGRRVAGFGVVVLVGLSACSTKGGGPASPASSPPALTHTTVMLDQHSHTITAKVDCTTTASAPHATPPESGDLTTRIGVHDDSAAVSLTLSDETPPSVDGISISLKVGNGQYQLPYQPTQPANHVQVTKDGKSYTSTGSGQGTMPGQTGMRQVTFGIHVTCA
ncbi:lipoprotein LpqH [Mycobacterium montefiorense]|uniref:Lipoprotein LppO n=1 Tax=Mycobacterium montefiorense TaxID=154654 RepID=A0AA37PID4_9MYCO|nr:lipoprotein LpqH [Mycobacterium montefiorense]GBG37365.1 putative lipoprotein LppO [Mycobacterium montefiorense]GKU37922.1 putative lipoprotein LppO [Mycobacterium montefiorense]GKU42127.1 putative lipoprotein LppO [Mycobacterium montefiorense]GKU45947.1 putative lipoprotein LppO [Mycobacterium montefiorense]GKU52862.1 putative lipoprotein LppO [Mycobacterium montefiorense]